MRVINAFNHMKTKLLSKIDFSGIVAISDKNMVELNGGTKFALHYVLYRIYGEIAAGGPVNLYCPSTTNNCD